MWLNVGCGTHLAPKPWVNTDTVYKPEFNTTPDIVVDPSEPWPFEDGSCERVMLSHVLEHIPWENVPDFVGEVRRVSCGDVLLVGPDAYRIIKSWAQGSEPWEILTSVLEHKNYPDDMKEWPGAPHHWNCHEARVCEVLTRGGFTFEVPADVPRLRGEGWPIVGWNPNWQFVLLARGT